MNERETTNKPGAVKKVLTAGLMILGVSLMVLAPLTGSEFLAGIFFFGGAATALTALVAKVKHGFMDGAFPQATREHDILGLAPAVETESGSAPVKSEIADGNAEHGAEGLELTTADLEFLAQAKIGE
ncbi:hypothetical protein V5R04_00940 [Jonesiaceae bacterium BS-20]|uniref:Uncharacterized protein n=1 Tax=Jonesiaceae bacterium BS-20 TaxID=3120821 RepID=A0AAU7DVT6_9MICO